MDIGRFGFIEKYYPLFLKGTWMTIQLALIAALAGTFLALIISVVRGRWRWLDVLLNGWVNFFRGTPLMFQLAFFHYGLPQITGWIPTPFQSGMIIYSLNSSAYLSEILRAGIDSLDRGQIEAAQALGIKSSDIWLSIIIPQTLRNILPAVMNEFISLIKETSVVSFIGLTDVMRAQSLVTASTYLFFEPLVVVGLIYLTLNIIMTYFGGIVERKLAYDRD